MKRFLITVDCFIDAETPEEAYDKINELMTAATQTVSSFNWESDGSTPEEVDRPDTPLPSFKGKVEWEGEEFDWHNGETVLSVHSLDLHDAAYRLADLLWQAVVFQHHCAGWGFRVLDDNGVETRWSVHTEHGSHHVFREDDDQ